MSAINKKMYLFSGSIENFDIRKTLDWLLVSLPHEIINIFLIRQRWIILEDNNEFLNIMSQTCFQQKSSVTT